MELSAYCSIFADLFGKCNLKYLFIMYQSKPCLEDVHDELR